jgi:Ca-activated chloride channel homolog
MKHDITTEQLTAYMLDELNETERAELEAILEQDAEARAILAELRATAKIAKEALQAQPVHSLTEAQREAIQAEPANVAKMAPRRRWRRLAPAMAAVLAIGVGVALLWPGVEVPPDEDMTVARHTEQDDPAERDLPEAVLASPDEHMTVARHTGQDDPAEMDLPEAVLASPGEHVTVPRHTQENESSEGALPEAVRYFRQGIALYNQGDYREALNEFNRARALDPDDEKSATMAQKSERKIQMAAMGGVASEDTTFDVLTPQTGAEAGGSGVPALDAEEMRKKRVKDLMAEGEFLMDHRKHKRALEKFNEVLLVTPDNRAAQRLQAEATVAAYDEDLTQIWEQVGIDRKSVRKSIEDTGKLPRGYDAKGFSQPRVTLTDTGADPYGPPGNGGFDPRVVASNKPGKRYAYDINGDGIDEDIPFYSSPDGRKVIDYFALAGSGPANGDHSFNGVNVFHDTNGNASFRQPDTSEHPEFNNDPSKVYWPGHNTEAYDQIVENPFKDVVGNPLSTFSIDVDTASYSNMRRFLNQNALPPKGAVRIEELVNYFSYDYSPPDGEDPFSAHVEVAACPWNTKHRLARIGLKGWEMKKDERPASNLVFLIDVSGSMEPENKLPLLRRAMKLLVKQLGESDQIAMVVYAGSSGLVLPSTNGDNQQTILEALTRLKSGGSTNGGQGIQLAYDTAVANFIDGGINRVILATDGDFNVGVTDESQLTTLIEEKAKTGVFLTVLGFGMGNLKDGNLEKLADKGNGNYAYIDTMSEARKVLVEEMSGTLVTIAKDVKVQVEFNPAQVKAYRLVGYENRVLAAEDFNDDTKDAGEIGAGHTVTALYELVPRGVEIELPNVDPLKYQKPVKPSGAADSDELLTLKLRYKQPDGETSKLLVFPAVDDGKGFGKASPDFKFASSVAGFGMLLRDSEYKGKASFDRVVKWAEAGMGDDLHGHRAEFMELVKKAKALTE